MHGKKRKKNTGHLSIIFSKNIDGSYTRNALLYQDIIKYSIKGKYKENDNKSFRSRSLTKWLLEENKEFINYFKDPSTRHFTISNRIENRLDRVKDKVNDLMELNLIEEVGTTKETKGNSNIPIYRHTVNGSLIALIIESQKSNTNLIEDIYKLLQNYFRESPSSEDIFYSLFYDKCKSAGIFDKIVATYSEVIKSDFPITHLPGFLQHLMIRSINEENNRVIVELWKASLNELQEPLKALFLHNFKLELEMRMRTKVGDFRGYEKMRFETRNNYNTVSLQGICLSCNNYTSLGLELIQYLEEIHRNPGSNIILSCPACGTDDNLVIPYLM